MDIRDKVAVITGGASGLGRATAETIVANGGKVALLDLNGELATQTAAELGNDAHAFTVNVSDSQSATDAVDGVLERFGAIHINVNCAGIGAAGRTLGRDGPLSLDAFNFVIQVNLVGTFNTLRLCAQKMATSHKTKMANAESSLILLRLRHMMDKSAKPAIARAKGALLA